MRKYVLIALVLAVSVPACVSAEIPKPQVTPQPVSTPSTDENKRSGLVEHAAVCVVDTLSSYALATADNVRILTAQNQAVTKSDIEVILRSLEIVRGTVSSYSGALGLHLFDAPSPNLVGGGGDMAPGFGVYSNGLDNMMFSKCQVKYELVINIRGVVNNKAFSTSLSSPIELSGLLLTGIKNPPNSGIRAINSGGKGSLLLPLSVAKPKAPIKRVRY